MIKLERYKKNPLISPKPENVWESDSTFNPGAVMLRNKVYVIYRAMDKDNNSTLGLAITSDGFNVEERFNSPIYIPRKEFEGTLKTKVNTGCEDPRLTVIGDKIFMLYTAVSVKSIRVAFTSIKVRDFLNQRWDKWSEPVLLSPPGTDDKDACLLGEKINGKYVFFHRICNNITLDFTDTLDIKDFGWIMGKEFMRTRPDKWDSDRIGIAGPPIFTNEGFVLIYHGRSRVDSHYRLGAALLDKDDPGIVLSRLDYPILEPEENYEKVGRANNVVFSCGQAILDGKLFVYYGGADRVVGVATCNFDDLLSELVKLKTI